MRHTFAKKHHHKPFFFLLVLFCLAIYGEAARAQVLYTSGHADIGIAYEEGELYPHWHLSAGIAPEEEYAPHEVIAVVSGTRLAPSGSVSALGVAPGSTIWFAGSAAYQPNVGFGAEELDPEEWVGESITLTLTSWSGPGEFALYTTNISGTSITDLYFSTFNPGATFGGNSFEMFAGDHLHFGFAFTTPGLYELEFTWSGTHVTDGAVSQSGTFQFNAVPEPSAAALLLSALLLGFCQRGRKPSQLS